MMRRLARANATRFAALWQRSIAVPPSPRADAVFADLRDRLNAPGREFHNLGHIDDCLLRFDEVRDRLVHPDAVEMALWFHDAIYDAGDPTNERRSADLFVDYADGASASFRRRVVALVMATERKQAPRTDDARFIDDIDLSGFGSSWASFARNSQRLREEFARMSDDDYYRGQWRFLSRLRRRPRFFRTPYFRQRYEAHAHANLDRVLSDLARRGYEGA